jgi:hypothetical protein
VLVQHRVGEAANPAVLEAWYAYADIGPADVVPTDLGRHAFGAVPTTGIVLDEAGRPCAGIEVDVSDETTAPGERLTRGVHVVTPAGEDGRFAFSIVRADGTQPLARVSARRGTASAVREDVRPGEAIELVLVPPEPEADVTLEVPWSEGIRLWLYGEERRLGFAREGGKSPEGAMLEERRSLPLGKYVVEVFRPVPGGQEWARARVDVSKAVPQRVRIEPAFQRARTVSGLAPPGVVVAWLTRIADGSSFVRGSATAGPDGRFELGGVPTERTLLRAGAASAWLPAGREEQVDVGGLLSR